MRTVEKVGCGNGSERVVAKCASIQAKEQEEESYISPETSIVAHEEIKDEHDNWVARSDEDEKKVSRREEEVERAPQGLGTLETMFVAPQGLRCATTYSEVGGLLF